MKIVALGRQSGKSTICLDHLSQNPNAAMVVNTYRQRDWWWRKHPELKARIRTVSEALNGALEGYDEVYVDDLDWMLYELFGNKPATLVTITQDDTDACLPKASTR